MRFEHDDQEQGWTPEDGGQWTKEPAKRDPRFDFAAFLGPADLEDRITDVLDGKDLMDEEAYGEFAPDYVPRRGGTGERGRHEAPGPDPEDQEDGGDEEALDGERPEQAPAEEVDFRQEPQPKTAFVDEPPPRPKVIVAEPAPRVYVDPQTEYGPVEAPPPRTGNGVKWLIAVLISAAVILGAVVLAVFFLPDVGAKLGLTGSADPTPATVQGGIPENRPTDVPAPAATKVPEATPVPVKVYAVTAAAGSGGSVSPSGQVDVEEGGSVSFAFTPEDGYEISLVVIDGAGSSIQTGYSFSDVRQDHSVYVEFQKVELPPAVEEPTPEPTDEPALEPTAEPTDEPAPEPTEEPAPQSTDAPPEEEPVPEPAPEGDADQGAPPEAGGEGEMAPPEIME